jgi:hypothetical protein
MFVLRPFRRTLFLAVATTMFVVAMAGTARADRDSDRPYFYKGYDYGSQAMFNPAWVVINRGFDVLQMHIDSRNIFKLSYGGDFRNVVENAYEHPLRSISEQGWAKFFRTEIFPVSYTRTSARWTPNYSVHLLAGGMTFTSLREWSRANGLSEPAGVVVAAATIMASSLLNETLENAGVRGRNTDCIADLWFFDVGGMILFSFESVNRFFSRQVILSDWSLQPSFTFPSGELHNQGNYFAAKWPLPFYDNLRLFVHFGMGTMVGLSYKWNNGYSLSAAGGTKITRLLGATTSNVENTVQFAPSAGVFIDRNNSLLASLHVSNVSDYTVQLNLYPHAIFPRGPGIGLWSVVGRSGGVAMGVSYSRAFGLGAGYAKM